MGRNRKYLTTEDARIARNKRRMKYYEKNKKQERKKSLNRYYENKWNLQNNK
jgi:hypothetical protein